VKDQTLNSSKPIPGLDKPIWAAAAGRKSLFLARGAGELISIDFDTTEVALIRGPSPARYGTFWGRGLLLSAADGFLAMKQGPVELIDLKTREWTQPPVDPLATNQPRKGEPRSISSITASRDGSFWFAGVDGLRRLDPKAGPVRFWRSQRVHTAADWGLPEMDDLMDWSAKKQRARISGQADFGVIDTLLVGPIVSVIEDERFLWILTARQACLFDPGADKIAGSVSLPVYPSFAAVTKNTLWIASGGFPASLARIDTRDLKQTSPEKWQPIRVTPPEVAKEIDGLPLTEKATFYWLEGNAAKMKELVGALAALPDEKVDPAHLFLMSRTYGNASAEESRAAREYLMRLTKFSGPLGEIAQAEAGLATKTSRATPGEPQARRLMVPRRRTIEP
jgi:hypothetical protein